MAQQDTKLVAEVERLTAQLAQVSATLAALTAEHQKANQPKPEPTKAELRAARNKRRLAQLPKFKSNGKRFTVHDLMPLDRDDLPEYDDED